ncbi:hypothetical protein ACLQ24_19895 [Micromonospora sp. DT4]|uniref:hypothetical protein n=1 Tax=Micromonospora sp. DT4 TaxID=3393438 RepID=UPI003CF7C712
MSVARSNDPDEIGVDPARLARTDEHFGGYVDDGRLAGWQVVASTPPWSTDRDRRLTGGRPARSLA